MDTNQNDQQQTANQLYDYAANLLVHQKMNPEDVKTSLTGKGIDQESASVIVDNLTTQIHALKKKKANNDMLYGALWCIGGTVLTLADIGYIFWGAIVFGGYQFIRGLINSGKN
jgi:hypothetical protein